MQKRPSRICKCFLANFKFWKIYLAPGSTSRVDQGAKSYKKVQPNNADIGHVICKKMQTPATFSYDGLSFEIFNFSR